MPDDALWAVTAHFNPTGSWRRLANFRIFAARLEVPLVAVELAFDRGFELREADADVLIRLRGGDVMWQKERLLNIGAGAVPDGCRAIAFVDADLIFGDPRWPERTLRMIEATPMVQLYETVHYLAPDAAPGAASRDACILSRRSMAARVAGEGIYEFGSGMSSDYRNGRQSNGCGWSLRRELVEEHGLFDGCIVGGGDSAMAYAAIGRPERPIDMHRMNDRQADYYRRWAGPFHADVGGRIDCVPADVFHLWHSTFSARRSAGRHEGLRRFSFDPYEDIISDVRGPWRWASDKPELHRYVADYFRARNEDADAEDTPSPAHPAPGTTPELGPEAGTARP